MMRRRALWLKALAAAVLLPALPAGATPPGNTILIASDSTAADYGPERYPQTGWGMMLPCGLSPDVRVLDLATAGRSTRSFIAEGRWDDLLSHVTPGDTVLIQFGHNDASRDKLLRYAAAETDYRANLLGFIWSVRSAGGTPVLLTPVARRSFDEAGRAKADFAAYSAVMRDLAQKTSTPLIDLEALSRAWVDKAGKEGSRALYLHYSAQDKMPGFPKGVDDDTHFSELGARGVADLVAEGLRGLNLPVSQKVLAQRPDLARTTPLGKRGCR